jgi:excisionase family DNA binding protein
VKTYEDGIYTPGMVAELFHVNPKTVSRWARDGKLASFKTAGGHRRFKEADVKALLEAGNPDAS